MVTRKSVRYKVPMNVFYNGAHCPLIDFSRTGAGLHFDKEAPPEGETVELMMVFPHRTGNEVGLFMLMWCALMRERNSLLWILSKTRISRNSSMNSCPTCAKNANCVRSDIGAPGQPNHIVISLDFDLRDRVSVVSSVLRSMSKNRSISLASLCQIGRTISSFNINKSAVGVR